MNTQQAFEAGLAPFQEIMFTFKDGTPLVGGLMPSGHWHHDVDGSVFIPVGVLYHRQDGRIGLAQ